MTGPLHTDLLGNTDLAIKQLAYDTDAKLATAVKLYVYPLTRLSVNGNGDVVVVFPGVTKALWGAVMNGAAGTVDGQRSYLDPVPPASIGRLLPKQPYVPVTLEINPAGQTLGTVWVHMTTRPVYLTPAPDGTPQWYGTQPVLANTGVYLSGIAWGPA